MEFRGYTIYDNGEVYNARKQQLKPLDNNEGYKYVMLKGCKFYIHRLVAMLYLENYNDDLEIDHANGKRDDNRVENLRCVTHVETRHIIVLYNVMN